MPATYGDDGLGILTLAEIRNELSQAYRDSFGDSFNIADGSEAEKEFSIYAEREALLQELIQFVYNSNYRSTSSGINLDYNLETTGQARQAATRSTVTVYARGTINQNIAAEALKVTVTDTGDIFQNPSSATLGSVGTESVTSITHTLGLATVTISGGHSFPDNSYVFITGAEQSEYNLMAQISNVTATTFDYTIDSGAVSPATGAISAHEATPIPMESEEFGPIVALAGTLVNISGSVSGVVQVENAEDADVGVNTETDAEARQRADETVNISGGGFREAIIAKLLNVQGVTSATLFSNVSNVIDSGGRPPGSVECFVAGGTDEDVADAVYNSVSDGINTFGNVTEIVTDSQGNDVSISFSRLAELRLYCDVTVTTNSDADQGPVYPSGGDDQIKAALALIEFTPGQDVWKTTLENAVTSSVPGIITINIEFDITPSPTNTAPIIVPPTQYANIDSGDVTIS